MSKIVVNLPSLISDYYTHAISEPVRGDKNLLETKRDELLAIIRG